MVGLTPDPERRVEELFADFLSAPANILAVKAIVDQVKKKRLDHGPPLPPNSPPCVKPRNKYHQELESWQFSPSTTPRISKGPVDQLFSASRLLDLLNLSSTAGLASASPARPPVSPRDSETVKRRDRDAAHLSRSTSTNSDLVDEKDVKDAISSREAVDEAVGTQIASSSSRRKIKKSSHLSVERVERRKSGRQSRSSHETSKELNSDETNKTKTELVALKIIEASLSSSSSCQEEQREVHQHHHQANEGLVVEEASSRPHSNCDTESKIRCKLDKLVIKPNDADYEMTVAGPAEDGIPIFYPPLLPVTILSSEFVNSVQNFFRRYADKKGKIGLEVCGELCLFLGLPYFLRLPLMLAFGKSSTSTFTCAHFLSCWQAQARYLENVDEEERVFNILVRFGKDTEGRSLFLTPEHLEPVLMDVLQSHPSLNFFRKEKDRDLFHHYGITVIASIFFAGEGWRRKRLYLYQARKISLYRIIDEISECDSMNSINFTDNFSYDQFYVVYSKFLNLDLSQDFLLSKEELLGYGNCEVLNKTVVDRIFEANVLTHPGEMMTYFEWVVFIKADVLKCSPAGLEYWFRVLDRDSDGLVTLDDFREFHRCSHASLQDLDMSILEAVTFEDLADQLLDATFPHCGLDSRVNNDGFSAASVPVFTLLDLKKVHRVDHILNAFFNVFKFLQDDERSDSLRNDQESQWATFLKDVLDETAMENMASLQ